MFMLGRGKSAIRKLCKLKRENRYFKMKISGYLLGVVSKSERERERAKNKFFFFFFLIFPARTRVFMKNWSSLYILAARCYLCFSQYPHHSSMDTHTLAYIEIHCCSLPSKKKLYLMWAAKIFILNLYSIETSVEARERKSLSVLIEVVGWVDQYGDHYQSHKIKNWERERCEIKFTYSHETSSNTSTIQHVPLLRQ